MTISEEQSYLQSRDAEISQGLRQLVVASGTNSREHGFHDDWPDSVMDDEQDVRRAIAEKLALIHEEVSEALGEIRSGHHPLTTYFLDKRTGSISAAQLRDDNGVPQFKPEGFLVELADAMIRIADLAFLVGDTSGEQLAAAQQIKAEYNATREYKHGRKF